MYKNKNILLRELRLDELDKILNYVNDYEIYSSFTDSAPTPKTYEFQKEWLLYENKREDVITFAIASIEDDGFLGTCQLRGIDLFNEVATLSIIIGSKNHSGKGYGKEAVDLLLNYGFNELNLNRIELSVYEDNIKAIKLYEKCGFTKEGVRREHIYRKSTYHNQFIYSILKDEFNEIYLANANYKNIGDNND